MSISSGAIAALLLFACGCREPPPEPSVLATTPGIESSLLVDLGSEGIDEITSLVADTDSGGAFAADMQRGIYLDEGWRVRRSIRFQDFVHRPVLVPASLMTGPGRIADTKGVWNTVGLYEADGRPLWIADSDTLGAAPNAMAVALGASGRTEFWVGLNGDGGLRRLDEEGRELANYPMNNVFDVAVLKSGTESIIAASSNGDVAWFDSGGQPITGFDLESLDFSVCDWPTLPPRSCLLTLDGKDFRILTQTGETVARLPVDIPIGMDYQGAPFQARDGTWGFALTATVGQYSLVHVYDLNGTLLHKERHSAGPVSGVLPLPLVDRGGFVFGVGTAIRRITWAGKTR